MAAAPVHVNPRSADAHAPSRLARWAVHLSTAFGTAAAVSIATVATCYAVGAENAVEDTPLGAALFAAVAAGYLGSLAGFVAAVAAKTRHERWMRLWIPLCVFPALLAFLVIGEALWWE